MEELDLFTPESSDTSIQSKEWIEYRPINQITDTSAIEFNIPAQSSAYMDLKRSLLSVKLNIVQEDGKAVTVADQIALINTPLHALFSQVEVSLQQSPQTQWGINYPYKAYIDTILKTNKNEQLGPLSNQLFVMDDPDLAANDPKTGSNSALFTRWKVTQTGQMIELEGPLHLDVFQQPKLLLNGVHLGLKLYQTSNAFRLMSAASAPTQRVHIVDARFKLCIQRLENNVLLDHQKQIQSTPAIYPYLRSDIKTIALAQGQFSYSVDDLFQGAVPSKLIVGLVSSEACSGSFAKNPFDFKHYDCNTVGFYVDGQACPSYPLQPNFEADHYADCYRTLTTFRDDINISRYQYKLGYTLYVLDIDPYTTFNTKRRGHCRLELKFAKALPESATVIVYATFPEVLRINQARVVSVQ